MLCESCSIKFICKAQDKIVVITVLKVFLHLCITFRIIKASGFQILCNFTQCFSRTTTTAPFEFFKVIPFEYGN